MASFLTRLTETRHQRALDVEAFDDHFNHPIGVGYLCPDSVVNIADADVGKIVGAVELRRAHLLQRLQVAADNCVAELSRRPPASCLLKEYPAAAFQYPTPASNEAMPPPMVPEPITAAFLIW